MLLLLLLPSWLSSLLSLLILSSSCCCCYHYFVHLFIHIFLVHCRSWVCHSWRLVPQFRIWLPPLSWPVKVWAIWPSRPPSAATSSTLQLGNRLGRGSGDWWGNYFGVGGTTLRKKVYITVLIKIGTYLPFILMKIRRKWTTETSPKNLSSVANSIFPNLAVQLCILECS